MSGTLLIVHHTPSPHCHEMFEAVLSGATASGGAWVAVIDGWTSEGASTA